MNSGGSEVLSAIVSGILTWLASKTYYQKKNNTNSHNTQKARNGATQYMAGRDVEQRNK